MKKLLVFLLCFLVFCFPLTAYAEETSESTVGTTTSTVVEDAPTEDENPSEEIEGDTTEETPNDENAPAEDDSSNGDIPEDSTEVDDDTVETPTEDETEDAPVDTPTDDTTETPSGDTTDVPTDTPTDEPTDTPTDVPVDTPTDEPVDVPTDTPTDEPTTETPSDDAADTPVETPTDTPVETPTDEPVDTPTDVPDDEPIVDTPTTEPPVENTKKTVSELVAGWLEANADTISLIISIIGAVAVMWKKLSDVLKAMGIINNNAVTVANDSATQIAEVKDKLVSASESVTGYNERISELLGAFSTLLNENKDLKEKNSELKNYLHTATDANLEFANELAELLALSNIPNYKKDEIGARHLEAVRAILDAESRANMAMGHNDTNTVAETVEEVKENDTKEA